MVIKIIYCCYMKREQACWGALVMIRWGRLWVKCIRIKAFIYFWAPTFVYEAYSILKWQRKGLWRRGDIPLSLNLLSEISDEVTFLVLIISRLLTFFLSPEKGTIGQINEEVTFCSVAIHSDVSIYALQQTEFNFTDEAQLYCHTTLDPFVF